MSAVSAVRTWPAACASIVVLAVAGLALTITRHPPREPIPSRTAIAAALRSPQVKQALGTTHWTRASAAPLDGKLERVTFFAGARTVADVAVRANGTVDQVTGYPRGSVRWGDWIASEPAMLVCFGALFVLMLAVVPLGRVRNLDVLAGLSLIPAILLFQRSYVDASTIAALPPLGYFATRCAWRGLTTGTAPEPSTPLFDYVTGRLRPEQRVWVLRAILAAVSLVFLLVVVSSPGPVDVVYAVMEGATKLVHGVLPYGHMPGDVIHGDTYPILSYALYAPLAWASPVSSVWASVDAALALAAAAALATAGLLARSVMGGFSRTAGVGTEPAGLRAAIGFLAFPSLLITTSTGTTDVVLGGMLLFALLLWRRPTASSGVLALAAWFKLAPAALVPLWLAPRRGRALVYSCVVMLAVSAASVGLVVGLGGSGGLSAMAHAVGFQFDRESVSSPWTALGLPGLQPVAEAAVLALISGASIRLWRDPAAADDRRRLASLAAAILLGMQLAANDWSFLYLAWVVPLIAVSLLTEDIPASVPAAQRVDAVQQQFAAPALAPSP